MPTVDAPRLEQLATTIFERSGAPSEHAALVAGHLVEANLARLAEGAVGALVSEDAISAS